MDLLLKGAIIEHRKNKKALSTKGSTAYHQYANFFNDMDKNWELKLEPPTNDWRLPDVWEGPNAFPDKHNTIDESVCFDYKVLLSFKDNIWMFDNNSKWHFLINLWERTATVEEVKEVKKLGKWNWEQSPE